MTPIPSTMNTVTGSIYNVFNATMPSVTVEAFDKDLRMEQLLGTAVTGADGSYTISYTAAQYSSDEYGTADIFIRVYEVTGTGLTLIKKLLGTSGVQFNVADKLTLDFKVDGTAIAAPAEFDALVLLISPLVESAKITIADLSEKDYGDISFLSGETGQDAARIALLPVAYQLASQTKIAADIFYGLFRLQFPTDLPSLLQLTGASITNGINTAVSQHIISGKWAAQTGAIVKIFNQLANEAITGGKDEKGLAFTKLTGAVLTAAQQKDFVDVYLANESTPAAFWNALSGKAGFTDSKTINDLKTLLQLNTITGNASALSVLLFNEQRTAGNTGVKYLAALSQGDWKTKIDGLVAAGNLIIPAPFIKATADESSAGYATALAQTLKQLLPNDVFISQLSKISSNPFQSGNDLKIFLANNDFNLKTTTIDSDFKAANLSGISNTAQLKNDLTVISRLAKISDDNDHIAILAAAGLTSATAIVQAHTAAQFADKFAASISQTDAAQIYGRAKKIDQHTTAIALGIKMSNDIPVYAINDNGANASPDYESLFGDTNCDCENCQSVYSPVAYFVDILNYLEANNQDAFPALIARRPDLMNILLTCENTNTPLPYIDLVNELLENAIAPVLPLVVNGLNTYPQWQTTLTADELVAYPEHTNLKAYDALAISTASFALPLNVALEETRGYLDKLSVQRFELMELFFNGTAVSKYSNLSIAAEYLQLVNAEVKIIKGETPLPVTLGRITDFLSITGLSYLEALKLLECNIINRSRSIQIVAIAGANAATCHIDQLELRADAAQSLNIMPFIRLWKKLGWDMYDLDRVFTALNISSFTADAGEKLIISLANIARLKKMFNTSLQNILTLWANIDTFQYIDHSAEGQPPIPAQFQALFQNKKISNPIDADFSDPADLKGGLTAQKASIIIAAFNLSQADFDTLSGSSYVDGNLTLANLSTIYRYKLLANMLALSVDDLEGIIAITGVMPLGVNALPADTLAFADKVALIRSSRFSVPELVAWLGLIPAVAQPIDINNVSKVLGAIRDGLQKIASLAPDGATDADKLPSQVAFISDTLATAFKTESKLVNVLIDHLIKKTATDSNIFIDAFVDPNFISSTDRFNTIDTYNSFKVKFENLINTFNLLDDSWNRISGLLLKWRITNDEFIYFLSNQANFSIDGIWNLPVSGTNLYPAFENLYNLLLLRKTLAAQSNDWYTLFDITDPEAFITELTALTAIPLEDLRFLTGTGAFNLKLPDDFKASARLLQIINCGFNAIKLGSNAENVFSLTITPVPQPATSAEDYSTQSALAKSILKSKYDEAGWLNVITPISKQLRIRKRNALLAYILSDSAQSQFRLDHKITDVDSLYAFFLVDMEMDACMFTSRIKQAISSVQLFVDRCLLNLEGTIALNASFTAQWNGWRSRYRVWEANRKIFLYPENWIEPELRDDKSPFFTELESELRQNDVTDDTVTDAIMTYLEKLDTIANLEIIGLFPDDSAKIVHVIGRTRNVPQQYYYTKQETGLWSAWEKIDLDIEGDHVLPVVWNNRLMLFWTVFKDVQNGNSFTVPGVGAALSPAPTYFEMKLVWSEYRHRKWTPKKISDGLRLSDPVTDKTLLSIGSSIDGDNLQIRVYYGILAPAGWWQNEIMHYPPGNITQYFAQFYFNSFDNTITKGTHWSRPDYLDILNVPLSETPVNSEKCNVGNRLKFNDANSLKLWDTGLYKQIQADDQKATLLLAAEPGYYLLSNQHEIASGSPVNMFYNSVKSNFYIRSSSNLLSRLPDDLALAAGAGISRKTTDSFVSNQVAVKSDTAAEAAVADTLTETVLSSPVIAPQRGIFIPAFITKNYFFQTFHHPFVNNFIGAVNISGLSGLYMEALQNQADIALFASQYSPADCVETPYPADNVDFDTTGVYSIYNWELFFHIPLLIATRLSQNQQFEAARKWFHYIFDPTKPYAGSATGAERFWITKPFKEEIRKGILSIEDLLNNPTGNAGIQRELETELNTWASDPFNPHAVARIRHSSYMRSTLMKYIDNLIAWGDQLFQQDTIETINEATLLYVLAANLLGKKPQEVPVRAVPGTYDFSTIGQKTDSFSNAKVAIESFLPLSAGNDSNSADDDVMIPVFCTPKNDLMLGYWDTLADRLFKIRHCLNIEGVFQQLPLFEPPIDPGLLVRAQAAGPDINNLLDEMSISLPNYRFQVMLQKAYELCNEVKALGSELLSALEKKDAEHLALLRSAQELSMLQATRDIKVSQRDEASENLNSLNSSKDMIAARKDYYSSRQHINPDEQAHLDSMKAVLKFQELQQYTELTASALFAVPQVTIGLWSWGATAGGEQLAGAVKSAGVAFGMAASYAGNQGNMKLTNAGYERRQDDWTFQAQSADLELKQMDRQIAAAEIRLAIAEKDLGNHDLQIEQTHAVDDYLNGKFTNEQLYDYMVGQISSLYFQGYQLAYNTAKKAEKCMQYELGNDDSSFIQFGYWDSLKKGLLSGERLQYDLRRLENAYLENNKRELEIVKHISLAVINPVALFQLRETGCCEVELPEAFFDLDYPGHYFRRVKSVSMSIPCIAGPYTSVNCTLTNTGSKIRKQATLTSDSKYGEAPGQADTRFVYPLSSSQSIATSSAQNDSGMFELNFRDERYLPFEGVGAISKWKIELNGKYKSEGSIIDLSQFDFDSISDIILHLKYTSRDGDKTFRNQVVTELMLAVNSLITDINKNNGLFTVIDTQHEFPDLWHKFLTTTGDASNQTLSVMLTRDQLPFFTNNKRVTIAGLQVFVKLKDAAVTSIVLTQPAMTLSMDQKNYGQLYTNTLPLSADLGEGFAINFQPQDLNSIKDTIEEIILVIRYTISMS